MPLGIPLPGQPGEAFNQGVNTGRGLFESMMRPKLEREKMAQLQQQYEQTLAQKQAEEQQRALRHQQTMMLKELMENRKQQEFEQLKELHPSKLHHLEEKIKTEQARQKMLEKGGNQRVTAAVQEADILYSRNDPRHAQYILNKTKTYMPDEEQMAEEQRLKSSPDYEKIKSYMDNAVSMGNLPAATQNLYRKQMDAELAQIDKAKQVKHAISQARDITKNNPGLYKKAINIIANPEASPGKIEKTLISMLPEKDVEAFMGLSKLYSDILTKQAQLNNMSRSVYALRLQQQAKAQVKNPDEVNEQIFKNLEYEIAPQLDREKPLLYAMKHNLYLPATKNYSAEIPSVNEVPSEISSPTGMGMMKGIINGKEVEIHPSRRAQFEEKGGRIL
jgi:hypothetical protein